MLTNELEKLDNHLNNEESKFKVTRSGVFLTRRYKECFVMKY